MPIVTDEQARRALLQPTACPDYAEMMKLGAALDRSGPAISGAPSGLVADILMMRLRPTWSRTSGASSDVARFPYQGFGSTKIAAQIEDGDEASLRLFAGSVQSPLLRARLHDVLWERFHSQPSDAEEAVVNYLKQGPAIAAEHWPESVLNIGRASVLIQLRKNASERTPLVVAFDAAAAQILEGEHPFAFAVIADTLITNAIRAPFIKGAVPPVMIDRWIFTLEWMAESFFGVDVHYGQTCYATLDAFFASTGRPDDRTRVRRRQIAHVLECSQKGPALVGAAHAGTALQLSLAYGFSDLVESAKSQLRQLVKAGEAEMQSAFFPISFPLDVISDIDIITDSSPSEVAAVAALSMVGALCEVPLNAIEADSKTRLQNSSIASLFPSVSMRDGKITFRGNEPDEKLREAIAQTIGIHLVITEGLLSRALERLAPRLRPSTFAEVVFRAPWLGDRNMQWLHHASERFHAQDFASAGVILVLQYEALVRELLRASGRSASKTNNEGILMDATLGSLLEEQALRAALGENHLALVKYVLCDPAFGPNLRNEIAHGNASLLSITGPRVMLIWLFIIRLAFLGPDKNS